MYQASLATDAFSTHPTIEVLRRRQPAMEKQTPGAAGLVAAALRGCLRPGVRVYRGRTLRTPLGGVDVVLQLEDENRRVAVIAEQGEERAALALVYGGYDAVYQIAPSELLMRAPLAAWLLAVAEPVLFTWDGLRRLEHRVAERVEDAVDEGQRVHAPDRTARPGRAGRLELKRFRLNRASDWVQAFERAVSAVPHLALSA